MASRFTVEAIFKAIDKISAPTSRMNKNVKRFAAGMSRAFKKAGRRVKQLAQNIKRKLGNALRIGLIAGVVAVGLAIKKFVTEASKIEDAVAAFQPLVGSVEKAKKVVDALNETAATTPFQFAQLSESANILLGFGAATQKTLIPTLRMLGDTAKGDSEKLKGISLAFSKIQAKGKASMKEINQLINNGIPIIDELNTLLGTQGTELFDLVRKGAITGDVITQAFKNMTSEGGRFFKGMEIASATFSGRMSTLQDNIDLTSAALGDTFLPILKGFVDEGIKATRNIRDWADANKELIRSKIVKFIADIKKGIKIIGEIFTKIGKVVGPSFDKLKKAVVGVVKAIEKWISENKELIDSSLKVIGRVIASIIDIFTAFTNIIKSVAEVGDGFLLTFFTNLVNIIGDTIAGTAELIAFLINGVAQIIKAFDLLPAFFASVWEGIKFGFMVAFNAIKNSLFFLADIFLTIFGNMVKGILDVTATIGDALGFDVAGLRGVVQGLADIQTLVREESAKPIIPTTGDNPGLATSTDREQAIRRAKKTENVLLIKDETGRAEFEKKEEVPSIGLTLVESGSFGGGR